MRTNFTMCQIIIPLDPKNLGGSAVKADAEILAERHGRGIARILDLYGQRVNWLNEFTCVYFQTLHDGENLKAIREATEEEFKKYRVPIWIQDEEIPECCSRPMAFVGQLDDDAICTEPPKDTKMWWHDKASFYVFTCSVCLSVKAVGQQF